MREFKSPLFIADRTNRQKHCKNIDLNNTGNYLLA